MAEPRVGVAVRVRPVLREGRSQIHQQEKFELTATHRMGDTGIQIREQRQDEAGRSSVFQFDHIFDQDSTQSEVYEDAVLDLIDGALTGVNATLLAYGQTGSGKTHTILGDVKANPLENDLLTAESGMFLRVLSDLLDYSAKQKKKMHVVIGLSCVEIYNEQIRDLFGQSESKGGKAGGDGAEDTPPGVKAIMIGDDVYMPTVITKEVTTMNSVFNEIQLATSRRKSRITESNASSSRSHCLFMIDILQRSATASRPELSLVHQEPKANHNKTKRSTTGASPSPQQGPMGGFQGAVLRVPGEPAEEPPVYCSKILLADLAGSEKIKTSGVTGAGLSEATSINMSLTSLGNVVHALHDGKFPSYRDSKLTQLLKPAFNQPQAKVLLLAQLSPTQLTFDESISTMHFANKVKAMKVQTSHGDATDSTAMDFLEVEKSLTALLADCRIYSKEHEVSPSVLRRNSIGVPSQTISPGSGSSTTVFGSYAALKGAKGKDRLQILQGTAAIDTAHQEKEIIRGRNEAKLVTEAEERPGKISSIREKVVAEHGRARQEAEEDLAHEIKSFLNQAMQSVTIEASFQMQSLKAEEDEEWEKLTAPFENQRMSILESRHQHDQNILSTLTRELKAAKLKSTSDQEGLETQEEEDEYHATACWCHCNARRSYHDVMSLRETQLTVFTVKRGMNQVEQWVNREKAAAEGKKGGSAGTPTTATPPAAGGSSRRGSKSEGQPKHVDPSQAA